MFDNQNSATGNQNQGANPPGVPGGVPPVIPPIPNRPAAPTAKPTAPPDMFAEVEPAAVAPAAGAWSRPAPPKPAVFQPKATYPSANMPTNQGGAYVSPAGNYNFEEPASKFNLKRILVLGGLVLAIAALAGGGWWGYKKYSGKSAVSEVETVKVETSTDNKEEAPNPEPIADTAVPEGAAPAQTPPVVSGGNSADGTPGTAGAPKDSDDDGLTDEEEAALGTNSASVDSDNDGLFDREEVKVYGTDPLKADTDGDGYADGQEVKGGFNPLGWGKLFDASNPAANKQ